MAKRRGLSWEDVFRGKGADDPARDTLKQKLAAAAGYALWGDGATRASEAAELKKAREELAALSARLADSKVKELGEAKALIDFAITKIEAGFARVGGVE